MKLADPGKGVRRSAHLLAVLIGIAMVCSAVASPERTACAESPSPAEPHRPDKIAADAVPETVADLEAMQDRVRRLAERVIPCTVGVRVGPAQGSGVIVTGDGYVLTAGHVAGRPGLDATILLSDGRSVRGKTVGVDRQADTGLVKITTTPGAGKNRQWPHVEMGRSAALHLGQWCVATGYPGGYEAGCGPAVRLGRILSRRESSVTTDCTLVGGDSGGPLFNLEGKVIGIHSRIGSRLNANIHVPIDAYRLAWDRFAAGRSWDRPGEAGQRSD